MSIQAVIWDLGGVLLRTEDYTTRDALAARTGLSRYELEELVFGIPVQLGEIDEPEHFAAVLQRLNIPQPEIEAFRQDFWGGDRLDEALVDYIRSLRGRVRTALLSNAFSSLRYLLNEQWHIADAFDVIVISAEEGVMKPNPRIYQAALQRLGVAPAEAVFIDDFQHNVEGARQVGLHAIHFRSPAQVRQELEALLAK